MSATTTTTHYDYLIIGAGVFGASTALHLSRQKSSSSILLIDRLPYPCPIAASHDINKAVRADYTDIFYCQLGLETLSRWHQDSVFRPYFHQSGMITIKPGVESLGRRIIANFEKLGAYYEAEVFDPQEMGDRFGGLFAEGDFSHTDEVYWNPLSGWAEAARALEATVKAAVENGVGYVAASVAQLLMDDSGSCTGIRTTEGQVFHADHIILSTGAGTAKLFADSFPDKPELQVGRRITAAAVCEAAVDVSEEQREKYKRLPVFVFDDGVTQGETMPITPDSQMKFIRDVPWKNTVRHEESNESFSVPLTTPLKSQWTDPKDFPSTLKGEIGIVAKGIYGEKEAENLSPTFFRMCWDGLTQDDNWYICPHPLLQNLYLATGGSFHGWKFLPILGEYVIRMLDGELSDEEKRRWEWDRELEGLPPNVNEPKRELRDIEAGDGGVKSRL